MSEELKVQSVNTSADYAKGYAEGFNDACKPAQPAPVPLQGGMSNETLMHEWQKKLPNQMPEGQELSAFAVGIEVGFDHARKLEKEDWSRVWHVLKKHGKHPGRTDDHLADVIDSVLSAAPVPADLANLRPGKIEFVPAPVPVPPGWMLVPVEPTVEMVDAARISGAEGTDEQIASDLRAAIATSPQHPVPVPLNLRQIAEVTGQWADVPSDKTIGIARAAIAKFCEVNGLAASPEVPRG